jgi:hypothetical protein
MERYPVRLHNLERFVQKSPSVRRIDFLGTAIYDSSELPEILELCAANNIEVSFGKFKCTTDENLNAIANSPAVKSIIYVDSDDVRESIDALNKMKKYAIEIIPIREAAATPQDEITSSSYGFYNLADEISDNISCAKLVGFPMIDFDGTFLGCWDNSMGSTVNAFDVGIDAAINSGFVRGMRRMLIGGRPNFDLPCARCPIYASLVWTNKRLDIK